MRVSGANVPSLRFVLVRFAADTRAATAIEYAMIAAGVGAAIAATIWNLGSTIQDTLYNKINAAIK
jgi:pilus assembly protein Flp/PilA